VIWLVTHHDMALTKKDGSFSFPKVKGPTGARTVLFTEPDSPAFLLAELLPAVEELRAERRVKVSGLLIDERRRPLGNYRIEAQRGWPEDWNTRYSREDDSFVNAQRDLELSPHGRCRTITGPDGLFELSLLPGTNILCFGAGREDGRRPLEVPNRDVDLGPVELPPKDYRRPGAKETLRGTVLDFSGRPAPGVEVRLWDGTVGQHSHVTDTDRDGRFSFSDLRNDRVILWATSMIQPHLVIPSQCSGTVHLPCNTPIVLRVPTRNEYWWARPTGFSGFFLFIRDGVFVNGSSADDFDVVGVPPGSYRVILLGRDKRILEGTFSVTEHGGTGDLTPRLFRNVTWQ
jgi:protocatechuate 3,4-dioxygenase beta subunit